MSFVEKYTTTDKVAKEDVFLKSLDAKELEALEKSKVTPFEKEKLIISSDAFAIGELLVLLSNRLVNK